MSKTKLSVTYNNNIAQIWIYNVPTGGPPLLGRNALALLDINSLSVSKFTAQSDLSTQCLENIMIYLNI